jgi:outer membrane protein
MNILDFGLRTATNFLTTTSPFPLPWKLCCLAALILLCCSGSIIPQNRNGVDMTTMLKKLLIATLVTSLPALAAAADSAPAPVDKPAAAAEAPQKSPAAASTESKPSDAAAARQTARIGLVDMQRILNESARGKAVEAKLKGMKDKLRDRVDAKRKQLDKLRASFETILPTLSQEQREAKAKEFQKKVEELQKFGKKLEEEFFTTQEKETKGLYDATEQAAVAYGKANSFAVIIVKKQLLYVGDSIDAQDVTDVLIKEMDTTTLKN